MPLLTTITGATAIGPFMQGPRLQVTPTDAPCELEGDDVITQCDLCLEQFAPDELADYKGRMLCEACEDYEKARAK
jgi:hypothetical protein